MLRKKKARTLSKIILHKLSLNHRHDTERIMVGRYFNPLYPSRTEGIFICLNWKNHLDIILLTHYDYISKSKGVLK